MQNMFFHTITLYLDQTVKPITYITMNFCLSCLYLTIQERLNRSLMVCQDKFEAAKLQKLKTDAANGLESCVNQAVDDNLVSLPHVVDHIKSSFSIDWRFCSCFQGLCPCKLGPAIKKKMIRHMFMFVPLIFHSTVYVAGQFFITYWILTVDL